MSAVAYYNLKTDDNGSNLDISANYSSSFGATFRGMEYSDGTDWNALVPYSRFQQNSTVDSYGYEFKGEYSHYFKDGTILEAGYEFNASNISNDFVRNDFDGTAYVRDEAQSNHFIYDEKVNALYATFDRMWGDVFSTTLGLRVENTLVSGNQVTSGESFRRSYWNFFPNLSIVADLADGNHSISLDFSRSIVRPFYSDLNPFRIWTSENTYTSGNIHLDPMVYNDVDLSWFFCRDYIIGAYYSYGTDAFSQYSFMAEDNTTVSSVANFGSEQALSFYFNMDKSLFNGIWRLSVSASADYDMTSGSIDGQDIGYRSWRGTAGIRNILNLSARRGIMATLSYSYNMPVRGVMKIGRHKHLLGATFSKDFRFGGSLSISAFNLLNYRPSYHYNTPSWSFSEAPRTNNISIEVSYTQRFGRSRVRGAVDRSSTNHLQRFEKK